MKKTVILILFIVLSAIQLFAFSFENDNEYKIYTIEKTISGETLPTAISPYPIEYTKNISLYFPFLRKNTGYELYDLFSYRANNYGILFEITPENNLNFEYYFGKKINSFWFIAGKYKTDWSLLEHGVFFSDALPYVNGITGGFTTDFLLGEMGIYFGAYSFNAYLTDEELAIQKMNVDGNSDRRSIGIGYYDPYKSLLIHRLDIKPIKQLRISLNELNLIGGKFPDLVDLNFMNILHNTYGEGYSNALFGLDGEIVPFKGIKLYGEFAMDDYVVPLTEAGAESYKPTAFAWGYGSSINGKYKNTYFILKGEKYKIYSWMYNRWQELLKFTGRYIDGNKIYDIPMGYDYGNDIESYLISLEFINKFGNLKVLYEHIIKGEIDLNTSYFNTELKGNTETWPGPYGETTEFNYTTLQLKFKNLEINTTFDKFELIKYTVKISYEF
ncbi:hypothetical protein Marpi_0199 [Marinitoga piezophila KA3]|uniref:Alginate export domain-containing protein n=1 Tax=Marinitoga piezophila (strain DSM 14283 / JCM 11233 / KA3) TaxID=443254 RepID=H2J3L0_MARPK|nr:hypothetical protein [Marinitoga piezophila]AEX84654.1 hypothetical protein Marpi_0199 [Marinitoga piezophila KA3]